MKIYIRKSPTADTRTCDFTKVSEEQLEYSSFQHIADVQAAINLFKDLLTNAAINHDRTKITDIQQFHADFITGFKQQIWYEMHKSTERHHISVPEGRRDDINLIDVLEHIADCVMAGKARSGLVSPLELPDDVLQKAFANTWKMLADAVEVKE